MAPKMKHIINGKDIKDLNKAMLDITDKIKNIPISRTAMFSMLEDARISKSSILLLKKRIKSKSKMPLFKYQK